MLGPGSWSLDSKTKSLKLTYALNIAVKYLTNK